MKLNLTRPLVFFDIESTGLDVSKDYIVELCYIKVLPNGNEEAKNMRLRPVNFRGETVHIPEVSTAIHGITDDDVKDCPTFKEIANELMVCFKDCDFAGFNSNKFDVPLLVEEFLRAGINIDLTKCRFVDV
ncbi:MAG: 3'-5' exonuclease, partial [Bacteroidaceae bacterium]|nr:3'-5' exonuclease [Bacteroidaceae bacterium]